MKRNIVSLLLLVLSTNLSAKELLNFEEAVAAVKAGQRITFVVDWGKCQSNYPEVSLNMSSSWTPEGIVIHKDDFLIARGFTYTHEVSIADVGPVYQAFSYVLKKSQELQITNRFLEPGSFAEKVPAAQLTCRFGTGFRVFTTAIEG